MGSGGTQPSFIHEGSAQRSKPLPFHIPYLTEKITFSYTFHTKWYPFHILIVETLHLSLVRGSVQDIFKAIPFKYLNDSFPSLFYTSAHEIPVLYVPPA